MFLEDNTFEIMTLENDILYESIHLDILKSSIMEDIYTENGNSAFDRFKKFIDSVVEKIKKFFSNAKKAIINFFTKKAVNDKLDDIEQSIKENPELGKRKVKIPDYKELYKLYEKTISDLEHRVEDSEKIMEKYKKERKRILIGAGLTTVSLATAIGIVKNIGKKTEERLNEKIKHDIDHSACKIYEAVERNMNYREESNQRWANLYASIMRDEASDSVKEVKDTVSAVVNNSKGE